MSRKLSGFLLIFSTGFTSFSVLLLLPCPSSSSLILCTVFDVISSDIDKDLLINASANIFFFRAFKGHHKDCLKYSVGADRPEELCYNFSTSSDLNHMVEFTI